jgi:hypothetical protein
VPTPHHYPPTKIKAIKIMNFNELGGFFSTGVYGNSQMLLFIKEREKQRDGGNPTNKPTSGGVSSGGHSASASAESPFISAGG